MALVFRNRDGSIVVTHVEPGRAQGRTHTMFDAVTLELEVRTGLEWAGADAAPLKGEEMQIPLRRYRRVSALYNCHPVLLTHERTASKAIRTGVLFEEDDSPAEMSPAQLQARVREIEGEMEKLARLAQSYEAELTKRGDA